jgi:hypothetical protein
MTAKVVTNIALLAHRQVECYATFPRSNYVAKSNALSKTLEVMNMVFFTNTIMTRFYDE